MANVIRFPTPRVQAEARSDARFTREQRLALRAAASAAAGRVMMHFDCSDGGGEVCFLMPGAGKVGHALASVCIDEDGLVLMDARGDPLTTSHEVADIVALLEVLLGTRNIKGAGDRGRAS